MIAKEEQDQYANSHTSERILVIYGSGYLGWLPEDVKTSGYCLRTLAEFAAAQ